MTDPKPVTNEDLMVRLMRLERAVFDDKEENRLLRFERALFDDKNQNRLERIEDLVRSSKLIGKILAWLAGIAVTVTSVLTYFKTKW